MLFTHNTKILKLVKVDTSRIRGNRSSMSSGSLFISCVWMPVLCLSGQASDVSQKESRLQVELDDERQRYQNLVKEYSRLEQRYENLQEDISSMKVIVWLSLNFWNFVFVVVFNMGFTHFSSIPVTGGSPLTRAVWARTPTTPPSVCQRQETLMTPSSRWR